MADNKQFGGPKIRQFGDKSPGNQPGDGGHCAQCEAMLADALDGTLTTADQELFDTHMAFCGPCGQMLADARRGAAWLEMLRHPQPEPPASLMERILAQTSGLQTSGAQAVPVPSQMQHAGTAAMQPADFGVAALLPETAAFHNVIPFRRRMVAAVRGNSFGHVIFQPRLAMTAAMAFFSIALTMNLTGVRLQDLHASDLRPSSLKRNFYNANASVVRYYEGLRVVYELESRVHDLQSASENDIAPIGRKRSESAAPNTQPANQPSGDKAPAAQPAPVNHSPAAQPEQKKKSPESGPNAGTSRREIPGRTLSLASIAGPEAPFLPGPIEASTAISSTIGVEGRLV